MDDQNILEKLKDSLLKVTCGKNSDDIDLLMSKISPQEAEWILKLLKNREINLKFFVSTNRRLFQYSEKDINQAEEMEEEYLIDEFFDLLKREEHLSEFEASRQLHRLNKLIFLMLEKEVFEKAMNLLLK